MCIRDSKHPFCIAPILFRDEVFFRKFATDPQVILGLPDFNFSSAKFLLGPHLLGRRRFGRDLEQPLSGLDGIAFFNIEAPNCTACLGPDFDLMQGANTASRHDLSLIHISRLAERMAM